ncbi:MAG: exodeoxyribonuclease VII large subunit, partial [Clostridia bacterium]|nr:exodeoxyribonuclease VII large subunit [Clostridia bacterium]
DVIIIGRGGGSAEDLWAFNNEELARMIAASPIPVISAVGHESDFTICDFVADRRAPTPSAAAELAVPEKGELLRQLRSYTERMGSLTEQRIAQEKRLLRQLAQSRVLQSPERLLDPFQMQLSEAETGLERTMTQYFAQLRNRIGTDTEKLEALSPLSVLARGYAAVKRDDRAVLRAESLDVGDEIEIHFTDGSVSAVVRGKE